MGKVVLIFIIIRCGQKKYAIFHFWWENHWFITNFSKLCINRTSFRKIRKNQWLYFLCFGRKMSGFSVHIRTYSKMCITLFLIQVIWIWFQKLWNSVKLALNDSLTFLNNNIKKIIMARWQTRKLIRGLRIQWLTIKIVFFVYSALKRKKDYLFIFTKYRFFWTYFLKQQLILNIYVPTYSQFLIIQIMYVICMFIMK